ncbi:MAG: IS982 family transposase [Bacteroidota bacterium]
MTKHEFSRIAASVNRFYKKYHAEIAAMRQQVVSDGRLHRNRGTRLSEVQMITILIGFHMSSYRFKHYYLNVVGQQYRALFPGLLSYNRFVELQPRVIHPFMTFLHYCCTGKCTGISFIDSNVLKVCHNRRIHSHKVFAGRAKRGRTSVDWFFGFKLHLIINDKGEFVSFCITRGNTDDRNPKVMQCMTRTLFGKLYGDKGYISKSLSEILLNKGIELITKLKKKMKQQLMPEVDKLLLRKRAIVESVNDQLKNISQVEHTRHRSANGFLLNLIAGMTAYCFKEKKPSLNIKRALLNVH